MYGTGSSPQELAAQAIPVLIALTAIIAAWPAKRR